MIIAQVALANHVIRQDYKYSALFLAMKLSVASPPSSPKPTEATDTLSITSLAEMADDLSKLPLPTLIQITNKQLHQQFTQHLANNNRDC